MTLSSIVCIASNNAIGKDNAMIWHIPEDLKHFKRTTLGKPILMGRKSYEALGKSLPGRANIVISRSYDALPEGEATQVFKHMEAEGVSVTEGTSTHKVQSINDAIRLAKAIAKSDEKDEIFITGGGQIYAETLAITERLYLTIIDRDYEGDTFFPEINWDEWNVTEKRKHPAEPEKDRPSCTFFTLERITK
ncbi:MAG: dihydrofolate reductase [Micavibrio sp.]|nr:dihydrofolate reductase [Micavibrio sp.]